jgi:hypothetical protein
VVEGEGVGRMLVELSVVEQRYQAVLAVLDGVPVVEVAARLEGHRQTVLNRPGIDGGSEATGGLESWRHRGSFRTSCASGRSGW